MNNRSTIHWWSRFSFWFAAMSVLTWKLFDPKPIPQGLEPPVDWAYLLAKSFHVCAFAFVTILGLFLSQSPRWRFGYAAFMIWYAIGTEIGQSYIPTRSGSVKDVAFDYLGITLGWITVAIWDRYHSLKIRYEQSR